MKDFGYNKDKKRSPSDDRFHVALALILWVTTHLINKAFGFEVGTFENGVVITIGALIWLGITLHDYFKNRQ